MLCERLGYEQQQREREAQPKTNRHKRQQSQTKSSLFKPLPTITPPLLRRPRLSSNPYPTPLQSFASPASLCCRFLSVMLGVGVLPLDKRLVCVPSP